MFAAIVSIIVNHLLMLLREKDVDNRDIFDEVLLALQNEQVLSDFFSYIVHHWTDVDGSLSVPDHLASRVEGKDSKVPSEEPR
jgi:hypothetical protein